MSELKAAQFAELVRNHVVAMSAPEPGKYAAIDLSWLDGALATVDVKTQQVLPLLDALLPAQWDAIAKIVAAGIHAASVAVNPVTPTP